MTLDLSPTLIAKSDQLNADDLIGGPMTITITRAEKGEKDQPVFLFYEGSGKKSFRPCKTMRRVMAGAWGLDAKTFVGKSLTVFRDDDVKFGDQKVGGVRISYMSHIDQPTSVSVIATKGRRVLYTVQPLKIEVQTRQEQAEEEIDPQTGEIRDAAAEWANGFIAILHSAPDAEALRALTSSERYAKAMSRLRETRPELAARVEAAVTVSLARVEKNDAFAMDDADFAA